MRNNNGVSIKRFALLCIFLLLFFGCKKQKDTDTDKEILIMTSFYPVYISTINITKDILDIKVLNLTEYDTGCIHNYSLTSDNMKDISRTDIFVINGAGMETFIDKIIKEKSVLKIIDSSKGVKLIEKNNNQYNPHIWVSIENQIKQIENIKEGLSLYDPLHKENYKKNADLYITKLNQLKQEMEEGLKDIKYRNIVTFHEAFNYFAEEFNFNIVSVIEREPGVEPNAKEMAETIKMIKKYDVKALFAEPQYSSGPARVIAKETGLKVYTLDPAVSGPLNKNAYIDIMKNNIKVLKESLN